MPELRAGSGASVSPMQWFVSRALCASTNLSSPRSCPPPAAFIRPVRSTCAKPWRRMARQGDLDGAAPSGALPSVSRGRLRPGPVNRRCTNGIFTHGRTGKGGSNRRREPPKKRNVDGGAAAARLPPDGRGDVPTPYFFKSQAPPAGQEGRGDGRPPKERHGARQSGAGSRWRTGRDAGSRGGCGGGALRPPGATPQKPSPPFVIETDLLQGRLQQPGRDRAQLAAQEIQGQRQQAARPGEYRSQAWIIPSRSTSRSRSPPPTSTGPGTSRRAMPTAWASPTSFPTATRLCARRSASRRTATSRRSSRKSTLDGKPLPHLIEWRGGFGDLTVANRGGQPAHPVLRRHRKQAGGRDGRSAAKDAPVNLQRQLLASPESRTPTSPRCSCRKAAVAMEDGDLQRHGPDAAWTRTAGADDAASRSATGRRQPLRAVRRARRTSTCSRKVNPEARAGGGFRLAGLPGQAAVPDRELGQRHVRPQLRLGHRAGHRSRSTSCCSR